MSRLDKATVLGSGVLGGQIAWHSAFKGKALAVYDIAPDAIERCRAAHDQLAAVYPSDVGADDADIAATRERLTYGTDLMAHPGTSRETLTEVTEFVLSHWARENDDAQMSANADYIKKNFLDRGRLGLQNGKGYYDCPDPAYQRPGFLDVPDISAVPDLVSSISPTEGS
ncbi:3-hydroxyacyl-CoA dehydrogenase NAD-binding domain-containing protein [Streptomyces sp. NBC_00203]|uniref:3-hydroxyacyl-CoA dehydrogenase NAD-binding domain-containing protein n=1 Tax=Streptomyces sp. NBC_00203 TaxID=2975680 RepID=UPI003256895E